MAKKKTHRARENGGTAIGVLVSPEERMTLARAADHLGVSISVFARMAALKFARELAPAQKTISAD